MPILRINIVGIVYAIGVLSKIDYTIRMRWIFIVLFFSIPVFSYAQGFASSDNFIIYAHSNELAEEILKNAEEYRKKMAIQCLGKLLPNGKGPCMIYVDISPNQLHGFTTPARNLEEKYHSISIKSSKEKALGVILGHEIAHGIMDTQFPEYLNKEIPRWAHEGIATLNNEDEFTEERRNKIIKWARYGNYPNLTNILLRPTIKSSDSDFFTVSTYFTQFLLLRDLNISDIEAKNKYFAFAQETNKAQKEKDPEKGEKKLNKAAIDFYDVPLNELKDEWHAWIAEEFGITKQGNSLIRNAAPPRPIQAKLKNRQPTTNDLLERLRELNSQKYGIPKTP